MVQNRMDGPLSRLPSRRVMMSRNADVRAAPSGARAQRPSASKLGVTISMAPANPVQVAVQRRQPTGSFNMMADRPVTIRGELKMIASASASGRTLNDRMTSALVSSPRNPRRPVCHGARLRRSRKPSPFQPGQQYDHGQRQQAAQRDDFAGMQGLQQPFADGVVGGQHHGADDHAKDAPDRG